MAEQKKFRFLLVPAFRLPEDGRFVKYDPTLAKEQRVKSYANVADLLGDVEWDLHEGALAPYGDWQVENREEFAYASVARLPIVKEACESGKYNAIVLLGGGEPGFLEAREITRKHGVVVTSCAFSQMHIACMLGNKFSVIDFAETHNMYYRNLVLQHRMEQRCASIRNIGYYHPRPGVSGEPVLEHERDKARRGERSEAVDRAVKEAVSALEEDGAEVITFGCSGTFWLQPFVEEKLLELGWEVPVLEGYSAAIGLAKMLVGMGVNASGVTFPDDRPKRRPRRVLV
ncbi:MAG: aspartate/glutamate racemase family protein [Nitrospinota bacterium]